jgi:hypothetical protein
MSPQQVFALHENNTYSTDVVLQVAVVVLTGPLGVNGTVTFAQPSADSPVTITGLIQGLAPGALRGFHVQCV